MYTIYNAQDNIYQKKKEKENYDRFFRPAKLRVDFSQQSLTSKLDKYSFFINTFLSA